MGTLMSTTVKTTTTPTKPTVIPDEWDEDIISAPPISSKTLLQPNPSISSSQGTSQLDSGLKRPLRQPLMPAGNNWNNTSPNQEEQSIAAPMMGGTTVTTRDSMKGSSMLNQNSFEGMMCIRRVYGARYDNVQKCWIYLHRLKGGGWVEHDDADTWLMQDWCVAESYYHDTIPQWRCVDYPSFRSRRARRWEDCDVEGVMKGNVRVKKEKYKPYEFTIYPTQDW